MTELRERVEALKKEAGSLQDALRPLRGLEALGAITQGEHERKEEIEARLREIREEADELGQRRKAEARASHAERKRRAREAEERKRREAASSRSAYERELSLRRAIIEARRERIGPRVGINVGGQPPGHAVIVELANRAERELALMYDEQALELVGVPAAYVRDLGDDRTWGIKLKEGGKGEIEASGPTGDPIEGLRRSVPFLPV